MLPKKLKLSLLLVMVELPAIVLMEEDLPPWEFSGCPLKGSTSSRPTTDYTPRTLNLRRLSNLATDTWLMFSGTVSLKDEVGLTAGHLYSVSKKDPKDKSDKSYTFTRHGITHIYPAEILQLDSSSYGFISCDKDEAVAMEEANVWWQKHPLSTISIILISLGVLFLLIVITSIIMGIIWRRKKRRNADLFPLSKRMRPKRDNSNYV